MGSIAKTKLILEKYYTIEELTEKVNQGARFVIFQYCISLIFAVTLRRFSPAYLIQSNNGQAKFKKKYNRISFIFGWWGISWGPIKTIQSLRINNMGGLDVTEDLILN